MNCRLPAPVHHLGFRRNPASLPGALVRAARAIRAFRPDVIHSNNFHGNMLARSLRLLLPRARVISTIHNIYEGGAMRRLALRLTDPLNNHTAAVSQAAAEEAIRRRVLPRAKCSVIANGIDCSEFTPQPERRIRERDRAGLACRICLACGWPYRAGQGLSQPSQSLRPGSCCSARCAALDCRRREERILRCAPRTGQSQRHRGLHSLARITPRHPRPP